MKIPVTWEMCGYVDVPCETPEEAFRYFEENSDHIKLPKDGEYVEASFRMTEDSPELLADHLSVMDAQRCREEVA